MGVFPDSGTDYRDQETARLVDQEEYECAMLDYDGHPDNLEINSSPEELAKADARFERDFNLAADLGEQRVNFGKLDLNDLPNVDALDFYNLTRREGTTSFTGFVAYSDGNWAFKDLIVTNITKQSPTDSDYPELTEPSRTTILTSAIAPRLAQEYERFNRDTLQPLPAVSPDETAGYQIVVSEQSGDLSDKSNMRTWKAGQTVIFCPKSRAEADRLHEVAVEVAAREGRNAVLDAVEAEALRAGITTRRVKDYTWSADNVLLIRSVSSNGWSVTGWDTDPSQESDLYGEEP